MVKTHNWGPGKSWSCVKSRNKAKTDPLVVDYLLFNFDSNSARLKSHHAKMLKGIAALLKSKDPFASRKLLQINVNVIVVGCADRTGDAVSNARLARERARNAAAEIRRNYPLSLPVSCQRRGKVLACTIMKNVGYSVSDPKLKFSQLVQENLTDLKKWLTRPRRTPKGGSERKRAVFVRVIMDIKPILPRAADLDYLFRIAKPFCEIEEIFFLIAPSLSGYSMSGIIPGAKSSRQLSPGIRRNVMACAVSRVYYYRNFVKDPAIRRMTVDDLLKEYKKRFLKKASVP